MFSSHALSIMVTALSSFIIPCHWVKWLEGQPACRKYRHNNSQRFIFGD